MILTTPGSTLGSTMSASTMPIAWSDTWYASTAICPSTSPDTTHVTNRDENLPVSANRLGVGCLRWSWAAKRTSSDERKNAPAWRLLRTWPVAFLSGSGVRSVKRQPTTCSPAAAANFSTLSSSQGNPTLIPSG